MKTTLKRSLLAITMLIAGLIGLQSFKSAPKPARYNVTFTNKYWNNMHLQVRVGTNGTPENNPLQDYYLSRGQSVSVAYDVLCWYRRDSNPDNANGSFTAWTSTGCFNNSPCTVDNP